MNDAFVLSSTVALAVILAFVYFVPLARQRRDIFRSDIRRLRDELFDFMWQNNLDYDAEAYRRTRESLNALIRVANALSVGSFAVAVLFQVLSSPGLSFVTDSSTIKAPDVLRRKIDEIMMKAALRLISFLFLEGMTGILIRGLVQLAKLTSFGKIFLVRVQDRIKTLAYALGTPTGDSYLLVRPRFVGR